MGFSFRPALTPPPQPLPGKCEVWSGGLCAMTAVIGQKMESSLSLCHCIKKQFISNECFFSESSKEKYNITAPFNSEGKELR